VIRLLILALRLLFTNPREFLSLIANLHTVCFFAQIAKQNSITHIHAYFLSWPALMAIAIKALTNLPFSISAHAMDIFVEHGGVKLKASKSKFIVTCTQNGLDKIKTLIPAKHHYKLNLCYHGINNDFNEDKLLDLSPKSSYTVLAVGRIVPQKGFETMIKAAQITSANGHYIHFFIVGSGPYKKQLDQLIRKLNLTETIHMLGSQSRNTTLRLINEADMLVVPSVIAEDGDRDGIPNVILEAFLLKTAVIASNLESIKEAVVHEHNGLLAESANSDQLSAAIQKLINDQNLKSRIINNAYATVKEKFQADKNTEQILNLFESS
jgi:glycosyltransferase involved in cell wall biosynthesis